LNSKTATREAGKIFDENFSVHGFMARAGCAAGASGGSILAKVKA
jgi:hypothetical protein